MTNQITLVESKRLWRVGLSGHLGRLEHRYYEQKGWIKGQYFVRPDRATWLEWVHCLVSPRYARYTWLRLTPEAEAKALLWAKRAVIALFVATIFTAGMIAGEHRMLHHIQNQQAQYELR